MLFCYLSIPIYEKVFCKKHKTKLASRAVLNYSVLTMKPELKNKIRRHQMTTVYVFGSDGTILCTGKGKYRADIKPTLGTNLGGDFLMPFLSRFEMSRLVKQFHKVRKNELASTLSNS